MLNLQNVNLSIITYACTYNCYLLHREVQLLYTIMIQPRLLVKIHGLLFAS